MLAQKLYNNPNKFSEAWNFGPNEKDVQTVHWILDKMIMNWPNATWDLDHKENLHEAGFLKLDISKARDRLSWRPVWELDQTLEKIIIWHKAWVNKNDMQHLCFAEIDNYTKDINK